MQKKNQTLSKWKKGLGLPKHNIFSLMLKKSFRPSGAEGKLWETYRIAAGLVADVFALAVSAEQKVEKKRLA